MNKLLSGICNCRKCPHCVQATIGLKGKNPIYGDYRTGFAWFCDQCPTSNMAKTVDRGLLPFQEIDWAELTSDPMGLFIVKIPDWCPKVSTTYGKVYNQVLNDPTYSKGMEKIASEKPSSNKGHDYQHVLRVIKYGEDFIQQHNKVYPDQAADIKDIWLFRIATLLHDFGRVDGEKNHSKRSAEFAQQFLEENTVINGDELDRIVKAIEHHSDGKALDDIVAVALYLGDKLDMTNKRVVADGSDELSDIVKEMKKIRMVNFYIMTDDEGTPTGVELRYETDIGFNEKRFSDYRKWIGVPLRVTQEYLYLDNFDLYINGKYYDYRQLMKKDEVVKDDHPVVV